MSTTSASETRRRVKSCEAMYCEEKEKHMFKFPKDESVKNKWTAFVSQKRAGFSPNATSRLCYKHFLNSDFSNLGMVKAGTMTILRLHRDSIPSVQMVEPSHAQQVAGIDLKVQQTSPTKRCQEMSEKERRRLLRTSPKTLKLQIPLPKAKNPVQTSKGKFTRSLTPLKPLKGISIGLQKDGRRKSIKVRSKKTQTCSLSADDGTNLKKKITQSAEVYHCSSDSESSSSASQTSDEWDFENEDEEDEPLFTESRKGRWFDEPKYIVCASKLNALMEQCRCLACGGTAYGQKTKQIGAFVEYNIACVEAQCGHEQTWQSSDVSNQLYIINVLLSACILFSGTVASKFLKALSFINVAIPTPRTFYRHQSSYLHGVIRSVYAVKQTELVSNILAKGEHLDLAGDGRCDTPGHSALYGIYSMMDTSTGKVVCSELIKSTEVSSSNAMEMEGLKRCRAKLEQMSIPINSLTTDRHIQIQAYMRDSWPSVLHFYDTWHIAKGLKKKLCAISSKKAHSKLARWIKSITNHMYWVVASTAHGTPLREQKWLSVLDHIANIHCFKSAVFPSCEHGSLEDEQDEEGNPVTRDWITQGSPTHRELSPVIRDKNLIKSISKAGQGNTSELESFHALLNTNAPKMTAFSDSGMLSRLQLTVLHQNENSQRPIQTNKDGSIRYHIVRKKVTKLVPTVSTMRIEASYNYVTDLMIKLEHHMLQGTRCIFNDPVLPTLASHGPQSEKSEIVKQHSSRGLQTKPHYLDDI